MKKIISLSIAFLVSGAYASEDVKQVGSIKEGQETYKKAIEWAKSHPGTPRPLSKKEEYLIFDKDGLPKPHEGVKVLPLQKMPFPREHLKSLRANTEKLNKDGYINQYNQNAVNLLMFKQIAHADFYQTNNTFRKNDTHLRHNIHELKMSYHYKGVPDSLVKEIFGFAPESTIINGGWAGAVEFFVPSDLGTTCSYRETNIKLTGSSAYFAEENVSYKVNGKITMVDTKGNQASGYSYKVEWWTDEYRRILECANKDFNPAIRDKVIALANKIEEFQ